MTARSNDSSTDARVEDKMGEQQIETVHTNERVPGHNNYYEKDGLRTMGKSRHCSYRSEVNAAQEMMLTTSMSPRYECLLMSTPPQN